MLGDFKRVLVVEDNFVIGRVLRFNLERAGLGVTIARNGREAWALLQDKDFDLVVTDYHMPEMNGYDLCLRMRKEPRYKHTPVVLLTARGLELEIPQLREELGVLDVFSKPFSPAELTRKIEEHLDASTVRH